MYVYIYAKYANYLQKNAIVITTPSSEWRKLGPGNVFKGASLC